MMRVFDLLASALLVSHHDQAAATQTRPPPAPGMMPFDHLKQPMPELEPRGNHSYDVVVSASADSAFAGLKWSKDLAKNVREFNTALSKSRFQTLSELIDTVVPHCGVTKTTGKRVNVTDMHTMIWQNDKEHEGFTHHGPCEAWIDDTRVYQSPDCRVNHSKYPVTIPIDFTVCEGNCLFKFYWLSVDEPEWHAYKQCAPINAARNAMKSKGPIVRTRPPTTATPVATPASTTATSPVHTPAATRLSAPVKTPLPTLPFPPVMTLANTKPFAPVKTPAVVYIANITLKNARDKSKQSGATQDQYGSDDDASSYHEHDHVSDDSDRHRRRRHHDSNELRNGDSDDSDDSWDATGDCNEARHQARRGSYEPKRIEYVHRVFSPPAFALYPTNKSVLLYQPLERRDQADYEQQHSDDNDDKRGDSNDDNGDSHDKDGGSSGKHDDGFYRKHSDSSGKRGDSDDSDRFHGHLRYHHASSSYRDSKRHDDAYQRPTPAPSHHKRPVAHPSFIVHEPHRLIKQNATDPGTAIGTTGAMQPLIHSNHLNQEVL